MEFDMLIDRQILLPAIFLLGGILAGLLAELIILRRLRKLADRTGWRGANVIAVSLNGMAILWPFLLGAYLARLSAPLEEGLGAIIDKSLLVIAVLSVAWVLARIIAGFINLYSDRTGGALPSTSLFANLAKLLVIALGLLVLLQTLGVSITPMLTALGIGGLAVALALQDTLSNLFAGFHIIASKIVKPGDYVKVGEEIDGYVMDVNWRNTQIRTMPNNIIIVPNSMLASSIVKNYTTMEQEMSIVIQLAVSYDSDLDKVEQVTIDTAREVLRETQGAVSEFEPFIRYHTFADFSINFSVILRIQEFSDRFPVTHEFLKKLHKRYEDESIEIPFPVRTVRLRNDAPREQQR
ncbi:MAG: mechanosensitive ion channel family protein [Thermoleophilia bacterium]|nr:mechanosensitive ion channel family protein [Thermoleophilia bacterium]